MAYTIKPQSTFNADTGKWEAVMPCATELRIQRDRLLKESDWTQAVDSPLSDVKKAEWVTYRQHLRDLPATYASETDLTKVNFPDIPT